jgi:hypothetical protein
MEFLDGVSARKLPSSPRHYVVYRGEGVSMDMSVGGGGRVDGVWRFRASVQSRRLRIITAGLRGGSPLPTSMCAVQIYREFFF